MERNSYIPALRFDWLTRFYDPVVRLTTREKEFKQELVDSAELSCADSVLDLACGSGTLAILLKEAGTDLQVCGIDGDRRILGLARNKAHRAQSKVSFVQGMSYQLPYKDESFEKVFSSLFFHHLSTADKLETLKEVRRVLKAGGVFHIADWGRPDNLLMKLGSYLVIALDGIYTTRDNFEGRLPDLIRNAGFADVEETKAFNTTVGTIRILKSQK